MPDIPFPLPRLIAAATAAAFAAVALAASAEPFLSPPLFFGNHPAACVPQDPVLAGHAGGGFTAAWEDGTVALQRFDRHAAALDAGVDVRKVISDIGSFEAPAVAVSPSGEVAVAWRDRLSGVVEGIVFGDGPHGRKRLELGAVDLGGLAEHEAPEFRIGLASGADGAFFAVWQGGPPNAALFDAESGVRLVTALEPAGSGCGDTVFQPAAAYDAVGDRFVAAWVSLGSSCITSPPILSVHARRFSAAGAPLAPPVEVGSSWITPHTPGPAVVAGSDGGFTVVWNGAIEHNDVAVQARRFGPGGTPVEEERVIADTAAADDVAATADPAGNLAVLWGDRFDGGTQVGLHARTFDPTLAPTSAPFLLDAGPRENGAPLDPVVGLSGPGEVTALWWKEGFVFGGVPLPCTESDGLEGRRLALGGDTDLLLRDGRFRVSVEWSDPHNGGTGDGHPLPESEQSGSFWFFEEGNRELMVKVLDGRSINGHWWVFYGSLTDVAFTLTVTDQATGASRTYENPPFTFASRGDTAAFDG
jgi:hypothetical protein